MLKRIDSILGDTGAVITLWEKGFLLNITAQVDSGLELTTPQIKVLERIEQKNSPQEKQKREQWVADWTSEKSEIARVVAKYYSATDQYFSSLAHKILQEGYVPTEKEYTKMCMNKYALKIREAYFKHPDYEVGTVIQVRKTHTANKHLIHLNKVYVKLSNAYAVILETNAIEPSRAASGAKVYKILPFGSSKAYYVSESDIKKARKLKK